MKIVSDLYKKIRNTSYYRSQFAESNNKKKVLFLDPIMTDFDWYTCLIPYFALEENGNIQTAVTGLYRFSELETKPQTVLSTTEIAWADVIVVPFTLEKFFGANELFDAIRKMKPAIKIIFTVEFDFYEIKADHYLLKDNPDSKEAIIERLEGNCKAADRILVMNEKLATKLKTKGFPDVKRMPVFYSDEVIKENVDFTETLGNKHTPNIFYLSCDLNDYNYNTFKEYIPVLTELQKKHKKNFKLIIIGDDPKKYYPKFSLDYVHLKRGSIIHKHKNIVKSNADCHLVLNKKTEYYQNSETASDYIERGLFSIPIIAMNIYPYNEFISTGENGFLLKGRKDLMKIVENHIKDKKVLHQICANVKADMEAHHEIDSGKLDHLDTLFILGYSAVEELE
jgi:hypothetical protein